MGGGGRRRVEKRVMLPSEKKRKVKGLVVEAADTRWVGLACTSVVEWFGSE